MIDPNWKDEREKQIQQKKAEDEVYAAGRLVKINTLYKNISNKSSTFKLYIARINFYISLLHKNKVQFGRLFLCTTRVVSNIFLQGTITSINNKVYLSCNTQWTRILLNLI